MALLKKKVCLLGATAVGKTSLVRRFVHGIFSEKYVTSVGVKIDKKRIETGVHTIELLVWDIYGEDSFQRLQSSYLRGAHGILLVADGTRPATVEQLVGINAFVDEHVGNIPRACLLNKADLQDQWRIEQQDLDPLRPAVLSIMHTSALTGDHVEDAFAAITAAMVPAS